MAAYCFRGEWGFPLAASGAATAYALGDVVTCFGMFWRCVTAGTKNQPSTNADWAPVANGQLLAVKSYNPTTQVAPGITATTAATAPAFDSTNLALTQAAFPNLRVPDSGRALVELEAMGYVAAQAVMYWAPLSSATAGTTFTDPNGQTALARVVDNTASDLLRQRRRGSIIISGLTPGAALNIYWGGFVSTSTGSITYGASSGAEGAFMKVSAV